MASPQDVRTLGRDKAGHYVPERALELVPAVHSILHVFLSGRMVEAEEAIMQGDPKSETLYFSLGQGLIQTFKSFMSFQNEDLRRAIDVVQHTGTVANSHRRHSSGLTSMVFGLVSGSTSGPSWIKGMTPVQRHAELSYSESILMKAVVNVLYSGDWLSFIREALNIRSVTQSYKAMNDFLQEADTAAPGGRDPNIDEHFRSGVLYGAGTNSLVLSLLPSRVSSVIQLFGYRGNRQEALAMLNKVGGWTEDSDEPLISQEAEGTRRSMADILLLIFHLMLSNVTYEGVNLKMARKILNWNLARYPNGVFFLFTEGRLRVCQSQPDLALASFKKMVSLCQAEYKPLEHISLWELGVCAMSLNDTPSSIPYWRELLADANWSKCVYTYALAASLLQVGGEANSKEADELMTQVPGLTQRIAGKSIPLEKFVSRKARRYATSKSLFLPVMDLSYHFLALAHAPRRILVGSASKDTSRGMLGDIEDALAALEEKRKHTDTSKKVKNAKKGSAASVPSGYWDDWCLGMFLKGVCLRYAAYPDHEAAPEAIEGAKTVPSKEDATKGAFEAFEGILAHATDIELDHHLVYYTHYELGRLYACTGKLDEGKKHLDLVLSGKTLVPKASKGKYSMESQLILRTNAALESLGVVSV